MVQQEPLPALPLVEQARLPRSSRKQISIKQSANSRAHQLMPKRKALLLSLRMVKKSSTVALPSTVLPLALRQP